MESSRETFDAAGWFTVAFEHNQIQAVLKLCFFPVKAPFANMPFYFLVDVSQHNLDCVQNTFKSKLFGESSYETVALLVLGANH